MKGIGKNSKIISDEFAVEVSSKTTTTTETAAQRALSNFTILSNIFPFIEIDDSCWYPKEEKPDSGKSGENDSYSAFGVLLRCCLVNKLWWSVVIPIIWRDVTQSEMRQPLSISELLYQVCEDGGDDRSRRQFYANFIEIGMEKVKNDDYLHNTPDYNTKRDNLLRDLTFPRLKTLNLDFVTGSGLPELSSTSAPSLVEITWRVPAYSIGLGENEYGQPQLDVQIMLDDISKLFPDIEVVKMRGYGMAFPGSLAKFEEKMKNLRIFEHDEMEEMEGYYPDQDTAREA